MNRYFKFLDVGGSAYKTLFLLFFLCSCASNQVLDITKSANYKIGDYKVYINSPKGYCINGLSHVGKKNYLQFVLTDCVDESSYFDLKRRPISSIISVNILYKPELKYFNGTSDLVETAGGKKIIENLMRGKGLKVKNSYIKADVLFLSLQEMSPNIELNTGKNFWKAFKVKEDILMILTTYGFSQKTSNLTASKDLERKLKAMINSISIVKSDPNKSS